MGMLIEGRWVDQDAKTADPDGRFRRKSSTFRGAIAPRPEAAPGRYLLIASAPCPWSHRTLIARQLAGLTDTLPLVMADPVMGPEGWMAPPGVLGDGDAGGPLHRFYTASDRHYSGGTTVPVLWDRQARTIVNNESADIVVQLLDGALPPPDPGEAERLATLIHKGINEGVYQAGYAGNQAAYEEAVHGVFAALETLDGHLSERRYIAGDRLTVADIYAFPTLIRFDPIYAVLMRCNLRRITEYRHVLGYLKRLYANPAFAGTVDIGAYRRGYFTNLKRLNPGGLIPLGPTLDLAAPAAP